MDGKRNAFLGWSGPRSRKVAETLRESLSLVIPNAHPWMSDTDIPKGSVWREELRQALNSCRTAIVVLTKDNVTKPWINFEAGAIYKAYEDTTIHALMVDGLRPSEGPLEAFQSTLCNEEDMTKMCADIAKVLDDNPEHVKKRFSLLWSEMQKVLAEVAGRQDPDHGKQADSSVTESILRSIQADVQALVKRTSEMDEKIESVVNSSNTVNVFENPQAEIEFGSIAINQINELAAAKGISSTDIQDSIIASITSYMSAKRSSTLEGFSRTFFTQLGAFAVGAKKYPTGWKVLSVLHTTHREKGKGLPIEMHAPPTTVGGAIATEK